MSFGSCVTTTGVLECVGVGFGGFGCIFPLVPALGFRVYALKIFWFSVAWVL